MKIATIPIVSKSDQYVLENYVERGIEIQNLEPLLFRKLYSTLVLSHSSKTISLWGFSAGERSRDANLWNTLNTTDLIIFLDDEKLLQFGILVSKLLSESVALALWGDFEEKPRQYLITFEKLETPNPQLIEVVSRFISKLNISRELFQVTELSQISHIFSERDSKLFQDFISSSLSIVENPHANHGDTNTEIFELLQFIQIKAGVRKIVSTNQGFNLTGAERKVVELRAIELATEYFENLGHYRVEDVGAYESYDLRVTGEGIELFVEVKGTTSLGKSIILTRNEVQLHKSRYPNNALVIVTGIELRRGSDPIATGGSLEVFSPWRIEDSQLFPLGFEYRM